MAFKQAKQFISVHIWKQFKTKRDLVRASIRKDKQKHKKVAKDPRNNDINSKS